MFPGLLKHRLRSLCGTIAMMYIGFFLKKHIKGSCVLFIFRAKALIGKFQVCFVCPWVEIDFNS